MKPLVQHLCILLALAILSVGHQACAATDTSPAAAAKPLPKAIPLSGKILETMNGGGYTYVLLKTAEDKVWIAIPLVKVSVGQDLTLAPGYEMKNFTSKSMNRKFDRLIFSSGAIGQSITLSPSALKMAHEGVPAGTAVAAPKKEMPRSESIDKPAPVSIERIAKAKGPNSYTIAQLYAKKNNLEKKPVVVRGRVVKVSPRVLKRNWIHIQDGSGSAAKKNNDLVITSIDLPKVGALVTAKGVLFNNLDFGSGYRYGLIVEGARFK